ncbi:MAG: rRNA small subunit methyltransferase B [Micrococcales bacterium]|nr:rRNA small subunit methyltransferase B [Micrococcales bacterium]
MTDQRDDHGRRDARGRQRGAARAAGRTQRGAQAPSARARTADPARRAAFQVLCEVAEGDAYANLVAPTVLATHHLHGRDAAFATELAYGTLRMRGQYDAVLALVVDRDLDRLDARVLDVLRLGVHQLFAMRVPEHAAVSATVGLARDQIGAGPAQLVNAVLRQVAAEPASTWLDRAEAAAGDDADARLVVRWSHPAWIVRALREALVGHGRDAEDLTDLLTADNEPPRVTLAARPGLITTSDLADQVGGTPGRLAPTAVVLPGGDPAASAAVRDGTAGVQDEGSQLVALLLAAVPLEGPVDGPDATWLDLCAGPGGKAALLGALAAQRGARLVANEVAPHRTRLVARAVRALTSVQVRTGDGREVGEAEPGRYDRVLVDAPCTGLGALRRRPESRWRRTPADLAPLGTLQRALLASALRAVRVGGVVGYVTCSPHLAETSLVVTDALRAAKKAGLDVSVVEAGPVLHQVLSTDDETLVDALTPSGAVQLWPHRHGTDAMFLTLLCRTA